MVSIKREKKSENQKVENIGFCFWFTAVLDIHEAMNIK
jgi:hypothetical protein